MLDATVRNPLLFGLCSANLREDHLKRLRATQISMLRRMVAPKRDWTDPYSFSGWRDCFFLEEIGGFLQPPYCHFTLENVFREFHAVGVDPPTCEFAN